MKISLNWLRDFVDLPKNINPQELAEKLSLHVVEVEGFEREADAFENVVVGKVLTIEKHPNADRLSVCKVDVGHTPVLRTTPLKRGIPSYGGVAKGRGGLIQIVCGGNNLRVGMLVAVALPGAKVKWHGEGELIELKEAEVRGVRSYGMICAGGEIGLDNLQSDQSVVGEGPHILDISHTRAKPGESLAQALGKDDVVFEISNVSLSNRPDLWSHYGIARELAVMYSKRLRPLVNSKSGILNPKQFSKFKTQNSKFIVRVEDKKLCPRYVGVLVENVHISKTPEWIRTRLLAVGQRPIHPLVDISNYVMGEMGQPVHVFDKSKIQNPKSKMAEIVVRKARKGERLKTLDGVDRTLDEEMLVIADHEKPIAIAGVMGGEQTGVSDKTNSIVVECATFEPVSIRKTSSKLGLKTDASQRFEKSLDPNLPGYATARVLQLIEDCSASPVDMVIKAVVDVHQPIRAPKPIMVPFDFVERRLGTRVSQEKAKKVLQGLGFLVKGTSKVWRVTPPSWRATRDVSIPEDIGEEIGRHFDYNTIPDTLPSFPIAPPPLSAHHQLERALKRFLAGAGFSEVEHRPFVNPSRWDRFGLEIGAHVEVVNPVDPAAKYLRQSLLPGLLEDIEMNRSERKHLKLFEWGRVFLPERGACAVAKDAREKLPHQPYQLSLIIMNEASSEEALREVKGIAASALKKRAGFAVDMAMGEDAAMSLLPGSAFDIMGDGHRVGGGGVVSRALVAALGIPLKQCCAVCTIDIDALAAQHITTASYQPLPQYPSVQRDLAIVVDDVVAYQEIETTVRRAAGSLLESLKLFDVFRGEGIPLGKKSLAFHITFRSPERTLKNEEADTALSHIVAGLREEYRVTIRE